VSLGMEKTRETAPMEAAGCITVGNRVPKWKCWIIHFPSQRLIAADGEPGRRTV
jgi:hypothetical protein